MAVLKLTTIVLLLPTLLASAMEYNNLADVTCGQTMRKQSRIVGGENAMPGEFPWLVSIGIEAGHFCGGTIVNKRFVLTAAHCFCNRNGMTEAKLLRVKLGGHFLGKPELPATIEKRVTKMIVHKDFVCNNLFVYDVTLLQLDEPIEWSENVQPACLPLASADRESRNTFNGKSAVAAGWGWLGEDKLIYKKSKTLQKVKVNVIEDKMCNDWIASQGKATRLRYGQMCAGHEAGLRDACAGDSGGPLMFNGHGDRTTVIGIVATGIGCARKRLPGIYTRVSEYMPWIIENAK